jgi:hypothetical protein
LKIIDHSLTKRALIIGIACFIIALAGFYLIFSWESWRHSQIPVIYDGQYLNSPPFEDGNIFVSVLVAIVFELILLTVLAGVVAALVLPASGATERDLSRYAGLAGAVPLALVSFLFWAIFLADLIHRMLINIGPGIPEQAWFYLLCMGVNVLLILAGALVSSVAGQSVWAASQWIKKCRQARR